MTKKQYKAAMDTVKVSEAAVNELFQKALAPQKKQVLSKKRFIALIAAIILLTLLSVAGYSAHRIISGEGRTFFSFFSFSQKEEDPHVFLGTGLQYPGQSCQINGHILTLESAVASENELYLVFTLEKTDGSPLEFTSVSLNALVLDKKGKSMPHSGGATNTINEKGTTLSYAAQYHFTELEKSLKGKSVILEITSLWLTNETHETTDWLGEGRLKFPLTVKETMPQKNAVVTFGGDDYELPITPVGFTVEVGLFKSRFAEFLNDAEKIQVVLADGQLKNVSISSTMGSSGTGLPEQIDWIELSFEEFLNPQDIIALHVDEKVYRF